jgi:Protein of unknown function (DUF3105)
VRTAPRDERQTRMILLILGGSAVLVVAAVLGFLFLGGGSDGDADAATQIRESGCTFETLPATPNLRFKGQPLRHVRALPKGFKYNSNPPTSGIHAETVIFGIYDEPVPTISTVHNLEHGAVVIRYGPDVAASEVEKIREFYLDDPNGLVVAPMPGLGKTIALTAWTFDQARRTDRKYEGEGRLAKCTRFDEDVFNTFVDNFRGQGPEDFPVDQLLPGGG